jgi:negative regulator of sigma E activity
LNVTVSDKDREYMRRIGAYKELSHREAQAEHLALSLDERFRRSWRLYERYRDRVRRDDPQDDPTAFYRRARELGLYEP